MSMIYSGMFNSHWHAHNCCLADYKMSNYPGYCYFNGLCQKKHQIRHGFWTFCYRPQINVLSYMHDYAPGNAMVDMTAVVNRNMYELGHFLPCTEYGGLVIWTVSVLKLFSMIVYVLVNVRLVCRSLSEHLVHYARYGLTVGLARQS